MHSILLGNLIETSAPYISIIIPVYGCTRSLHILCQRLHDTLIQISNNYEIILINDASPDNAWEVIQSLAKDNAKIKAINLSRNFGQHHAITAGLDFSDSEWTVVMDCDLQDQPEEILKLYAKAKEGFDIVFAKRYQRKDSYFKILESKIFYKIYNYFTESQIDSSVANFSIISKNVVKTIHTLKESNRSFPLFLNWVGFHQGFVNVEHSKRLEGKSSYTYKKLINLAIDSIISQSNKPLKLSIKFGFSLSFLSLLYSAWLFLRYFLFSIPVEGWTSVMVSIYFIAGLLFANMGILGLYIGKTFDETKHRPLYIIKDTIGLRL